MIERKTVRFRSLILTVLALFAFNLPAFAADQSFNRLPGRWVGKGWLQLSSGDRETIRCTATYFVKNGGASLNQNLRCASASYTVVAKGVLSNSGGRVSGTWTERNFDISGKVSGTAKGGTLKLKVSGNNLSANFSVQTNGTSQSVRMSTSGSNISKMVINLRKG